MQQSSFSPIDSSITLIHIPCRNLRRAVRVPHPLGLPHHQDTGTGRGKQQQMLSVELIWTSLEASAARQWSAARQHPAGGWNRWVTPACCDVAPSASLHTIAPHTWPLYRLISIRTTPLCFDSTPDPPPAVVFSTCSPLRWSASAASCSAWVPARPGATNPTNQGHPPHPPTSCSPVSPGTMT
jgi:hypothetical protein